MERNLVDYFQMLVHLLDELDHLLTSFNNRSINMGPKKVRDIKRARWASGRYRSYIMGSAQYSKFISNFGTRN